MRWNHVSHFFKVALDLGADLFFQQYDMDCALMTPDRLLEPFAGEGQMVSFSQL